MSLLEDVKLGLLLVAAAAVVYLPFFLVLRKRLRFFRQLTFFLFGESCFVILFATVLFYMVSGDLTFFPSHRFLNLIPLQWLFVPWEMGEQAKLAQVVANVLLFVPFGFFLSAARKKSRTFRCALPVWLLLPIGIEAFQYLTGRSADIDDVLLNALGAMLGYAAFRLFARLFRRKAWWNQALGEDASAPQKEDQ